MKYLNLTNKRWSSYVVLSTLIIFLCATTAYNQCSLACNGSTQVSLDVNCEANITPEMILNDQISSCPAGVFAVEVSDAYGVIPTSPIATADYIGQTLYAKIIDTNSGNSCWGNILLEDKLGPLIESCPTAPIDIACSDLATDIAPIFIDACEGEVDAILLSESIDPIDCDPDYIKTITRIYTAVDSHGKYAPQCTIVYRLLRIDFDDVTCPPKYTIQDDNSLSCDGKWRPGQGKINPDTDTNGDGILDFDKYWDDNNNGYPEPEEIGVPTITSIVNGDPIELALYPFPDVYCNSVMTYSDLELPKIGCVEKIMRTWTLREWHCNGEELYTCLQVIEIVDDIPPVIECPGPMQFTTNTIMGATSTSYGDVTCGTSTSIPLPSATDNCSGHLTYDLTYNGGFESHYDGNTQVVLPMGTSIIEFAVYDKCYNSSVCQIAVEILDNTPPVAICDQYTAVSLTTGGVAVVNATTFDDGSYDDCKDHCMLVRRMTPDECECKVPEFCDFRFHRRT